MKKSGSNIPGETPEQELNCLRKENAKLKTQKEADKAKIKDLKKELKSKPLILHMSLFQSDMSRLKADIM